MLARELGGRLLHLQATFEMHAPRAGSPYPKIAAGSISGGQAIAGWTRTGTGTTNWGGSCLEWLGGILTTTIGGPCDGGPSFRTGRALIVEAMMIENERVKPESARVRNVGQPDVPLAR